MQGPNVRLFKRRTVPGYAAVRGEADTNAFVTVNERPVARTSEFFHGGNYADNTLSNLYADLEIYAAINPSGTNTPDTVYSITTSVFVAKTSETFTYDSDGNMASDGRFTYTWNADNRLVCASNAEVVVTYAYDYRGRMVRKDISHIAAEPQSICYTWDNWNIIREAHVSRLDSRVTHNVWGLDLDGTLQGAGGVGGLLAVIVPRPMGEGQGEGATVFLPCYDANGNITEYVTTNGEIVAHYDYSTFGEPLVSSGPLASTFTHRFSTKPWCANTGLVEYQMRKYRPDIGRWMSRDPIGEGGGLDIYSFVLNSSVNNEDTLGKNARVRLGDRFPNYHVQICVDIYDQNGSKSGENCYGFTPIPLGIWETATWRFGCPCKGYAGVEDAILGKIVEINYGSTCSPEVERRLDAIVKEVIESETGTQTYLKWSFNCNDWLLRVTDRLAAKLKELEKALEACNTPLPNIP